MSKHTPGPWAVWPTADSMIDVAVGPAVGGVAVCQIVTADGRGINTAEAMERGNANARLIAAAPELLAALRKVSTCLSAWMEIADPGDLREYDDEALGEALAAIRQATGD